jgi:hypothetical protein
MCLATRILTISSTRQYMVEPDVWSVESNPIPAECELRLIEYIIIHTVRIILQLPSGVTPCISPINDDSENAEIQMCSFTKENNSKIMLIVMLQSSIWEQSPFYSIILL